MKIKSKDNFLDYIQGERAWRKKELTSIKSLIHGSRKSNSDALIRSGVLLLYAHWEGYVKKVCEGFFFYMNFKALKYCQLQPNFIALGVSEEFNWNFPQKKYSSYARAVSFILDKAQDSKFYIDVSARVDTKSNLNYEVLSSLLNMLGVVSEHFENNQHHIDNRLLKYRNAIAHGERTDNNPDLNITFDDFSDLESRISELIDHFETLVINHVELETYKISICS